MVSSCQCLPGSSLLRLRLQQKFLSPSLIPTTSSTQKKVKLAIAHYIHFPSSMRFNGLKSERFDEMSTFFYASRIVCDLRLFGISICQCVYSGFDISSLCLCRKIAVKNLRLGGFEWGTELKTVQCLVVLLLVFART